MKRVWFIIVGGLSLAVAAYACVYLAETRAGRSTDTTDEPVLAWMQREYQLSGAQFARVCQLHQEYQPKCMEMCRKIDDKNMQLQLLLTATNVITPEIEQKLSEAAQLRAECQKAMFEHFYEIARVMPVEQGRRYLAWMQQETLMPGQMPSAKPPSPRLPRRP